MINALKIKQKALKIKIKKINQHLPPVQALVEVDGVLPADHLLLPTLGLLNHFFFIVLFLSNYLQITRWIRLPRTWIWICQIFKFSTQQLDYQQKGAATTHNRKQNQKKKPKDCFQFFSFPWILGLNTGEQNRESSKSRERERNERERERWERGRADQGS